MLKLIMALARINKISHIHPGEKAVLSLIPIIVIGFTHSAFPIMLNIVVFSILHYSCRNNKTVVIKFTLEIAAFAAFSSLTFIFDYGIQYCLIILLKSISAGMCLSFFALTTPMDDALFILAKNSWLKDMCDIAKAMERFLVVIYDEYHIIYNSIKSRGGFEGIKLKIKNTGKMAGLLFANTMNRWKSIKDGLESRGYRGYTPYLNKNFSFSKVRFLGIFMYIIMLTAVVYIK